MNKQELASRIWESANAMRSKIEAHEYKDYILGLIFYKFLSENVENELKSNNVDESEIQEILQENNRDVVENHQNNFGYFISYENLFSTWIKKGIDFDISNVRDALSAFDRLIANNTKHVFNNIFNTLQTGLSKLGENPSSQTKVIKRLIEVINDIPMDGKQGYDILGFVYEYLISMFAATAGKKAGEFYTPHEVSLVMSEIVANHLKHEKEIKIYDPTSGSGSLLINIGQSIEKYLKDKDQIKYYAQELKENTYSLTRMNLVMRGIKPHNIIARNGDTLKDDWPYFDESDKEGTYDPLYVDAVVSNPPYSQVWEPKEDKRYSGFGLAPKSKADYAFLLHDLFHLKPNGIMTIVLPHGVLFRGNEEGVIRKNLIEENHIEAVIGLPENIFFGTSIPTIIMVVRKKRSEDDILFVDASKGFIKVDKDNKLRASDIKKIVDTVVNKKTINKYSRLVSKEEIRQNDYNLNIPRYVDSSPKKEVHDLYASIFGGIPKIELDVFNDYWNTFESLKSDLFDELNSDYLSLKNQEIEEVIFSNTDVKTFIEKYKNTFTNLRKFLAEKLITDWQKLNIWQLEEEIVAKIFAELKSFTLFDEYEAYQIFNDMWVKIIPDLETLKIEGNKAINKIDANMVIRKKDGKNIEVADGHTGRILPFKVVQKIKLKSQMEEFEVIQNRLDEISAIYKQTIEDFTEDEKDELKGIFNEDKGVFKAAELQKIVKKYGKQQFDEDSIEFKLSNISNLINEEKKLKMDFKTKNYELNTNTREIIENLSLEEANELLLAKWVDPLLEALYEIPNLLLEDFTANILKISKKYEQTYISLEQQIAETENNLSEMIEELEANDFDKKALLELQKIFKHG
ncbi:type I restriction-modification system subunit M [Mesomycoplasma conjunctivae]|uniref:type I restriction-modification system subunit M n=1 Tax=Mesomycoplasma conjunctivae TaxID=45361 RepID=UPI003DA42A22